MSDSEMTTKPSEPDKVDAYMRELKYPLKEVVEALRTSILSVSTEIGEEVKWNSPAFFYSGPMRPFNPKEYKRYLFVFNLFRPNVVLLVFPHGARVDDGSGFLSGDYANGRRLVRFHSMDEVKAGKKALRAVIKEWLKTLDK